jgi:16S rRNA processing protein RimM
MADWDAMVTVGRIVRPHGHRGAVVVAPESDFADERFQPGAEVQWLADGRIETVRMADTFPHQGRWVVTFDGVATMNDAEALRDRELKVAPETLHELAPGAHYVHDLQGCLVVTAAGVEVGRVARVDFGTGTPVLAVAGTRGDEVLVPLAEEICREIDPAGKRIVIDPPAGLIELNRRTRT